MNVGELVEILSDYNQDAEVHLEVHRPTKAGASVRALGKLGSVETDEGEADATARLIWLVSP